jgi:hypothetical protein
MSDPNVKETIAVYPLAFCCADSYGYYITSEHTVVGKGRSPMKAWKNAAEQIKLQTKKGLQATRPKTPRKGK